MNFKAIDKMNPFKSFEDLKSAYSSYIQTFQKFKDKRIEEFVDSKSLDGKLLWQDPIIQISKRFKDGKTLNEYVKDGILIKNCLSVFVDKNDQPIKPYYHQSEAIDIVSEKNQNLIVTTGTGSGKSMCFSIPIINHCLIENKKGTKGIKAIIIYPLNALANSQYSELVRMLERTDLKIGLYTGDTKNSLDEALKAYKENFGKDSEPKRCEIIHRLGMQQNPPDILITNYVQLELLLTRLEDRKLFAEEYKENLRFLVLDEIHTYSGKRGTDVAYLIRRLKQKTNTKDRLLCIGTSATMVSDKAGENPEEVVANFATKLFGETFQPENVVKETEEETVFISGNKLSKTYGIDDKDLLGFNSDNKDIVSKVYKGLIGENVIGEVSRSNIGELLKESRTVGFIEEKLSEVGKLYSFNELVGLYKKDVRPTFNLKECAAEIQAGLLLGMTGTITTESEKEIPRFIPKLHSFFNQGNELKGCLATGCGYLSDTGETICPKCQKEGRGESTLYPLHFCRTCGQSYYGLKFIDDVHVEPWTFQDYDTGEQAGYFTNEFHFDYSDLPETWLTPKKREVRKNYQDRVPINGSLDASQNTFQRFYYDNPDETGVFIPQPLPFCINCGTEHIGNVAEYTKLFLLNSIGRATGTNILVESILESADKDEKKVIGFSDNRQDAAFQAGHLNHWYSQIFFRKILLRVINELNEPTYVNELPKELTKYLQPDAGNEESRRRRKNFERVFLRYIHNFLFVEIRGTKKFTSRNLEDVGLIEIEYEDLLELAKDKTLIDKYESVKNYNPELLYEFLKGFLDIFRFEVAVAHEDLINKEPFRQEVIRRVENEYPELRIFEAIEGTKAGGFTDGDQNAIRYRYTPYALRNSRKIKNWIKKSFGIEDDEAVSIVFDDTLKLLEKEGYIIKRKENYQDVYLIDPEAIMIKPSDREHLKQCPKCDSKYSYKHINHCINLKCKNPIEEFVIRTDYYYDKYISNEPIHLLKAEEHSGQVAGDKRKQRENDFKEGKLQFLMSTPTMELGIDIGDLSSVFMRNVPPNPSNYSQRSGRAGRSGQGSIITTFCGSGIGRGVHDQYYFNHPKEIVAGKISVPRFNLENKSMAEAHINSLILQSIDHKLYSKPKEILIFGDAQRLIPMNETYRADLIGSVSKHKGIIIQNVMDSFSDESNNIINETELADQIDSFVENLNGAFDDLRADYRDNEKEIEKIDRKIRDEGGAGDNYLQVRRKALEKRNQNIREGEGEFYVYKYLSRVGFLPNYAFPRAITKARVYNKGEEEELVRDQIVGLNEYAPLNTIYYDGQKFTIQGVTLETDYQNLKELIICDTCQHVQLLKEGETKKSNCPECGATLESIHPKKSMVFPRMQATRQLRISAEEEERVRSGYEIIHSFKTSRNHKKVRLLYNEEQFANIRFERSALMFHVNRGNRRDFARDGTEGFTLDIVDRKWLSHSEIAERTDLNPKALLSNILLFVDSRNDILVLTPSEYREGEEQAYSETLLNVILQSISNVLNLDESELRGFVQPVTDQSSRIVIFETSEGGTGTLSSIVETPDLLKKIATKALEILHYNTDGTDKEVACEKACYNCICNYYNQRFHSLFDRALVRNFLLQLANVQVDSQEEDYDSRFEELITQADSDLEKTVLTQIKELGLSLPDEMHKVIFKDDVPIASADLFYEKRTCIFIDGPDHDKDYVKQQDEEKRSKLKSLGYRVEVVRYDEELESKLRQIMF